MYIYTLKNIIRFNKIFLKNYNISNDTIINNIQKRKNNSLRHKFLRQSLTL
jgi:hypothetical protein